jgi:MFS family permease
LSTRDPLFTPRFFVMCGFSFTVFLSAFQLLPTAPYRILALGGSKATAGLFLGFLTYASALTAPLTGSLADRFGKRRMLVGCSLVLSAFAVAYAATRDHRVLLGLAVLHGGFWSGLLSASSAYITDFIPARRRAEGIGYWGLSTILAIAVAPTLGFWLYDHGGWTALCASVGALNLVMAAIAWRLQDAPRPARDAAVPHGPLIEWRVLVLSMTLFLYSFGYGGITSFVALYADHNHVLPREVFFTTFAVVVLLTRPISGPLGDRIGYRRVFIPCLALIVAGLAMLASGGTRPTLIASAVVFGTGFGTAYPMFAAHVMRHVAPWRRGAAFGSILAAFDTGIGSGSIVTGWIVQRHGFGSAYAAAAALAALSIPFFLVADRRLLDLARRSPAA